MYVPTHKLESWSKNVPDGQCGMQLPALMTQVLFLHVVQTVFEVHLAHELRQAAVVFMAKREKGVVEVGRQCQKWCV